MASKAKSRGSSSGCFMRFLGFVLLGYLLLAWLPRCAQQLPQLAGNAAGQAASGLASTAGNAVSNLGRGLLHRIESLFSGARDQWNNLSPADKFDFICEHTQIEGVDKLCPYFTSALQGASDAQTARIACYWHAAATAPPNPQQRLQAINGLCAKKAGDPSSLEDCLSGYINTSDAAGDAANCQASAPQQLWPELHTMTEPIACIPGLPKSLCTTQASSAQSPGSSAPTNTAPMRTDVSYLNCLQNYYLTPAVRAQYQMSCGTSINTGNEKCISDQLAAFQYPGQVNLGQQYLAFCATQ